MARFPSVSFREPSNLFFNCNPSVCVSSQASLRVQAENDKERKFRIFERKRTDNGNSVKMAAKRKFYVVWEGKTPGIYDTWDACRAQVEGVAGAVYKSFATLGEAETAFAASPLRYIERRPASPRVRKAPGGVQNPPDYRSDTLLPLPLEVPAEALAVDAACSGNPGKMEYRGVYLKTGQELFRFGPVFGTNNIGEFLAIVHGLALLHEKALSMPLYSDSRNALLWVRQKKCKTTLARTAKTEALYRLIERAERWLQTHTFTTDLRKWRTDEWGEIPADFGRK